MYHKKIAELFERFGNHQNMVLSTCQDNKVFSRTMSVICIDEKFYVQTNWKSKKCISIKKNPNVSLCIGNLSVEGLCKIVGKPIDNKRFVEIFKVVYPKAYDLYSRLEDEVLLEITPKYMQRWIYENDFPYIETYDIRNEKYIKILQRNCLKENMCI